MAVQTEKIRQMLDRFGWKLIEARTIARLWVAEIWLVKSTWSPNDCEVYLTFESDPQGPSLDFSREWLVRPSLSRPYDWYTENAPAATENVESRGLIPHLSTEKEKHLAELFKELADLRDKFKLSAH